MYGVRPLIEIPKSEIVNGLRYLKTFEIDNVVYATEYALTWEEWVDSKYNTNNFEILSCGCVGKDGKHVKFTTSDSSIALDSVIDSNVDYDLDYLPCSN